MIPLCDKLVVKDGGGYDMVVVGGEFAGMVCTKVAAQHGLLWRDGILV